MIRLKVALPVDLGDKIDGNAMWSKQMVEHLRLPRWSGVRGTVISFAARPLLYSDARNNDLGRCGGGGLVREGTWRAAKL